MAVAPEPSVASALPDVAGNQALAARAAGLGLRRALLPALEDAPLGSFDFLEAAPENWIGIGGALGEAFARLAARHPLACHGLSLSLGGPAPLDAGHLARLRRFLDAHAVTCYSEHLSACGDSRGQLYDLLPLPFTEASVHHVAARIRQAQDVLGRRVAVENISYYAAPFQAMPEVEFINAVLGEADCLLLLDVNNVIVNATNHGYDANAFLDALPGERIACIHVAGHFDEAPDLKIDTHGSAVGAPVWGLLERAYARFGPRPTVLERDFNLPPFPALAAELGMIRERLQAAPSAAVVDVG